MHSSGTSEEVTNMPYELMNVAMHSSSSFFVFCMAEIAIVKFGDEDAYDVLVAHAIFVN